MASNEFMNIEPGLVLYGPERSHDAVAAPFVDARSAGVDRVLAVLRQLLQLDHKLWRNTLLRRLLAFSDAVAILVAIGLLTVVARDVTSTFWLIVFDLVVIVLLRRAIHVGLLEESLEVPIGPELTCPNCGELTARHTFCGQCGISLQALPKARRPTNPPIASEASA